MNHVNCWITLAFLVTRVAAFSQTSPPTATIKNGWPVVSPDGRRIAYISNRDGADDVYAVNADGTGTIRLTHTPESEGTLGWSTDGKNITFSVFTNETSRIYSVGLNGGSPGEIGAVPGRAPTFSPDGKRLLYTYGSWTANKVIVSGADGANPTNLTEGASIAWNNHWSPDTKRIAFTGRNSPGGALAVFVMNSDGSGVHQVTKFLPADGNAQWPVWSPDGRELAIQVNKLKEHTANIWIIDASTGAARQLAIHEQPYLDETPAWFPDGTRLAFQSNRTGTMQVWTMKTDGSEQRRITR